MFADNSRRAGQVVTVSAPVLLLTDTTAGTRNFTVPSGYSSFKIELVGGKGGDDSWGGSGGIGAKVTLVVPVADMPVGSTQSYTVGTDGVYGTNEGTNGTSTVFKGMTAGGGFGSSWGDGGINYYGSASGTAYTNTTPNQWSSPASIKIWGIA
jgi:hypothetical protein